MYQLLKMNILLCIVIDIGDSIHYLEVGGGVWCFIVLEHRISKKNSGEKPTRYLKQDGICLLLWKLVKDITFIALEYHQFYKERYIKSKKKTTYQHFDQDQRFCLNLQHKKTNQEPHACKKGLISICFYCVS